MACGQFRTTLRLTRRRRTTTGPRLTAVVPAITTSTCIARKCGRSTKWKCFLFTKRCQDITCKSRCRWNWRTCRTFANTRDLPPLPKVGGYTAKASDTKWDSIKIPTHASVRRPTICGGLYASWSTPACITKAGPGSRRSTSSWTTLPRPRPTSLMKLIATFPGRVRRSLTKSGS